MIFSELYSVYYNTVAKILSRALEGNVTEKDLQKIVAENAFSESVLNILPSLKSGKWQLMNGEFSPVVKNKPTMPLTLLQKRWLKALLDDPRIRLFDMSFPEFDGIAPLFTTDDYKIYDKYSDGDDYENEDYIKRFKLILYAIKQKLPVEIKMLNRTGREVCFKFYPIGFEYSEKDDKFRVIADKSLFGRVNMNRITECEIYNGKEEFYEKTYVEKQKTVVLTVYNERNALERVMLHFAHFEKQAEKNDDNTYTLKMKYYENDETEIAIRILSFGQFVKVEEPSELTELIKQRLISQKECGLL